MDTHSRRPNQIFISYRRRDSAGITGRIYDRLIQKFGREVVFKDVDSTPLGVDFREYIDSEVKKCNLVLVVIGDRWLGGNAEGGNRLIDDPRDFVRIEIESALDRKIPVIPLFVQGATMPPEEVLPQTIKSLAYRNGIAIGNDPHFHSDVDRLIKKIESNFASLNNLGRQRKKPESSLIQPPSLALNEVNQDKRNSLNKFIRSGVTLLITLLVGWALSLFVSRVTNNELDGFPLAILTWVTGLVITITAWRL
jgi:hypothetical protein